jgi:predicted porin
MKKNMIAVAVAAMVAAPAIAQNVTIGGYIETGYQDLSFDVEAQDAARGIRGSASSVFGSSRLVIGGSEDLGGGMKVGFRLESTLDVSQGQLGSDTLGVQRGSSNSEIFNRGAELSLEGAFGRIRIGQFDHRGGEDTDINVVGNIALNSGITGANNNPSGVEIGSDRKGTFAYRTPSIGGATIEIAHSAKDSQKTHAETQNTTVGQVSSLFLEGSAAGFNYRVGYAQQKMIGTAISATNNDASRYGIGATYDFGFASASASYARATLINQNKNREVILSAKYPLGNGLDARLAFRDFATTPATGATVSTAPDQKQLTVALAKAFSKRTTGFVAYTDFDRTGGTLGDSSRAYVGIGHSF